ncbi:MAG: phosphatase PAP2 family protein [Rhodobacterales bacterium]|nr:phosphatase PAP2 family protein [Rhodobacterales bacterium]
MPLTAARPSLLQVLRLHALLAGLVAAYLAISYTISSWHQVPVAGDAAADIFMGFLIDVPMMIFFVLLWRLLRLTYVQRDPNRFATLAAEVRGFVTDRSRIWGGLVAVVLMTGMMIAFGQMKNLIPVLNPYSWDEAFMHLDKMLHFGVHPYQIAHAVFGSHYAITFFTGLYNIWMFLMFFVLFGACFTLPDNPVRMQFLIAFLLTWAIGGNLLATIFSSAGPVYFAQLGLGDTYAGLMQRLQDHASTGSLTVINIQNLLWDMHTGPKQLNGISAFPSMHVASSVLMAIFLGRLSPLLGRFAWVFAVGIMIGSVLLAWHYAVDGYAGALIALASWYAAGWLVRLTKGHRLQQVSRTAPQA